MGIQIYDQISITRNCSEVKLRCVFSLELGLKGVKIIARNVAKFGVNDCLSNGHPNIWSSFHSKKYIKSEIPSYSFVRVWLKGAENNSEHMKVGVHTYHPNAHQKIWSNFNFDKFVKSETPSCGFAKVGVKGGENSLERREKIVKSETSLCIFAIVQLKAGSNSSKHYKIWCACLYIKRASKSMIKFQF